MPQRYTMKMSEVLWKAGFDSTEQNRRLLDKAVRETLSLPKNEDLEVWEHVQKVMGDPTSKKDFERKLIKLLLTY